MMKKHLVLAALFLSLAWASHGASPAPERINTIAFGSCLRQDRLQPIWAAILRTQPDVFVFLGDTVYADTGDPQTLRLLYEQLRQKPGFARLKNQALILGTWDDHDYGENDGDSRFPMKKESQRAFLDFYDVPMESPRRQQNGVYHAQTFGPEGKRVQIILLDLRTHALVPSTLLGEVQWLWLEEQLRQPAELRLVASSIQLVAKDHRFEKWANFPSERARFFALLKKTRATNVIVLSGDRHHADMSLENDVFDVTSSALNAPIKPEKKERNRLRVSGPFAGANFGLISVFWEEPRPRVSIEIRDEEGHIQLQQSIFLQKPSAR